MRTSIDNIFIHNDYKALIREDFLLRSSNNENFSLRAYSKKVGISPTTLSLMFQSKRDLSFESYKEVLKYFDLTSTEQEFAEALFLKDNAKKQSKKIEGNQTFLKLRRKVNLKVSSDEDREMLGSSLITVLVFNCYNSDYLRDNTSEIQRILNLSSEDYQKIEDSLILHECIEKKDGKINVLKEGLVIDQGDSEVLLNHILDIKDFSKEKIKEHGKVLDKENCLSLTYHLQFDKQTQPEVVKLFKKFQDELYLLCSRKSSNENYYFLNFDFFKVYDVSNDD
jgi:hypothetical protein